MASDLRALVRSVLTEVLADARTGTGEEVVAVATDADLQRFACRVLVLGADPEVREAVLTGKRRFRLSRESLQGGQRPNESAGHGFRRIEKGAVTERHVLEAAAARTGLVLGRRAVLTPLARDVARARGVAIEREGE